MSGFGCMNVEGSTATSVSDDGATCLESSLNKILACGLNHTLYTAPTNVPIRQGQA